VLTAPGILRRPLITADAEALTVGEMIAAMRDGLGRWRQVFPLPPVLFDFVLRSIGQGENYRRLSRSLVADPSALIGLGWAPRLTTSDGLSRLMQETAAEG